MCARTDNHVESAPASTRDGLALRPTSTRGRAEHAPGAGQTLGLATPRFTWPTVTQHLSLAVSHLRRRIRSVVTAATPARIVRQLPEWRRPAQERGPEHRSIMVLDICGFGRWRNRSQLQVRTVLRTAVRTAFHRTRINWSRLSVEDCGDGMIILIPAAVSKADLLDPLIPTLTAIINHHNATVPVSQRVRLRISVHAGELHRDATGWVGTDLILACRLVNSPALYRGLQQTPTADLIVAVSDTIYHGIVQHAYRHINPSTYTPHHVTVKEVDTRAWIHIPNSPLVAHKAAWVNCPREGPCANNREPGAGQCGHPGPRCTRWSTGARRVASTQA